MAASSAPGWVLVCRLGARPRGWPGRRLHAHAAFADLTLVSEQLDDLVLELLLWDARLRALTRRSYRT